jgi:PAS domain S-box-containing protein
MDTDRNLLFGVLALQADLIDSRQFIDACLLWTSRKDVPLADLLVERGWIEPDDRAHVDYLLRRKLHKHGGDAGATLAAIPDEVKRSLAALKDDDIQRSLGCLPAPDEVATVDHLPGPCERYSRLRLHATGGIGRVWLARDGDLGRDVALKELRPEQAEEAALRTRFLQEAQITGQLEHPGIVPVYELVRAEDGRRPFYVMRFVKGRTLSQAARDYHHNRRAGRAEPLELPALLNAFVTVCNTAAYAHSRGVVHRDLKGQNILLGDFGEVVVLDWGLAKRLGRPEVSEAAPPMPGAAEDSAQTVQGQTLGTPGYMAPEQAAGRPDLIGRHTDVYGLGAVLYEVLTGRAPFVGPDTATVLRRVQEEAPPPPRESWPEVPPALEALCLRALAKRPEDRPAGAAELAQEVQGWQEFERRKAEEALRESEALYHSLVECLPCNVFRKDLEGRFTFANQRFCDLVGLPLDRLLGKTSFDISRPELAEKYRRDDRTVIETGAVLEDIEELPGQRYVHILKTAVRDAGGRVIGVQGISWDVTERKLAEEELRKSRERFELAVQGSQDGLWDWDLTTDEVYYSPRYKAMLGYEENESPTQSEEWAERLHPDDRERVRDALRAEAEGRESLSWLEFRMRHKDGSYRWIRSRAFILRDAAGRIYRKAGSHEDITERKNAEEELARERHLLRSFIDALPEGIYFKDREGRLIRANRTVAETVGCAPAQLVGKTDFDLFAPEVARQSFEDEREIIRTGRPLIDKEEKVTWRDGLTLWVSSTKMPLRDPGGHIIGTFGITRDITKRKLVEEELRKSRERFELAVQGSQDGLWDWDLATDEVYYSSSYKAMLGYEDHEFPNRSEEWARRVHPEDIERVKDELRAHFKGRESLSWIEFRFRHKDGSYRWIRSRAFVLRDATGRVYRMAGSHEDITDRKTAEGLLAQARERLACCRQQLRRLAASVRGKAALDKLPEGQRQEWRRLGEDVAALQKTVEESE